MFENLLGEIYNKYDKGASFKELALEYGVHKDTIRKRFKANNLYIRGRNQRIDDDLLVEMYKYYSEGKSSIYLSKKYDIGVSVILDRFKKAGLEVRSNKVNSRKYELNHNYFDNIDTQDKAYWLGFMYADGYVTKNNKYNGKYIGLSLARKDKYILESFNKCLESTYKVHDYISYSGYSNNTKYSRLLITSDRIFDSLIKHGCVENKTNVLNSPKINKEMYRHFIRGYIDGDGCIYSSCKSYNLGILGTKNLLLFIHNYFKDNNLINKDFNFEKCKDCICVGRIRYGGNIQTKRILDDIYRDSNLKLDRKYKRYLELCEVPCNSNII